MDKGPEGEQSMWFMFLSNLPELVGLGVWSVVCVVGGYKLGRWRTRRKYNI